MFRFLKIVGGDRECCGLSRFRGQRSWRERTPGQIKSRGSSLMWSRGNFSSPSDVEGSALIGGNASGTWQVSSNQTVPASTPTLVVGGTLTGNVHIESGSLFISNASAATAPP